LEDALWWIEFANSEKPVSNFAIEVDGAAVGAIGLLLRDDVYRLSAEIGYWLGEEFWGRGIASRAVAALSDYAFASFGLCRLYAEVFEWNPASMRVLEKAGYQFEGRLRKGVIKDGQVIDACLYALVREKGNL
jgi:RimJ/RimL family protein N-acetyltransferase